MGRGELELESQDGILQEFYENTTDALRAYFLEDTGRTLEAEKEVPLEVLGRLRKLWTWRLQTIRNAVVTTGIKSTELSGFGWWFHCGKFGNDWAIRQLNEALSLSEFTRQNYIVVERLAVVAAELPTEAVQCLAILIEKDKEGLTLQGWAQDVETVLKEAIQSGSPHSKQLAEDLVHRLGALGHFGFRHLLQSSQSSS